MKPFTWSWSKLKNYRTCPKRHYEIDLSKNIAEPQSDALDWGHEVHDAMAKFIALNKDLPLTMEHYAEWPTKMWQMRQRGMTVKVENKLAMSKDFKPTNFFDGTTWFRTVVDALSLGPSTALALDWKTGAVKPDYEQLGLSAQVIFAHYPKVDEVMTAFIWLGHTHDDGSAVTTKQTYRRDGMAPLWNDLWPEINQMAEAYRTTTYPPKPSGLCIRHCPVVSCPHHGKGSR